MSYTNYVVGVQSGAAGAAGSAYNFLVSGLSDYTGATSVMIKNDVTKAAAGNTGTRISQDNNDNAFYDFRTTSYSTDGAKALSIRMQDDSNPTTGLYNMLVLNKDTLSSTSVYGATVGGRVNASQYYVGQADTRTPATAGVYMGFDANTVGYFKVNKGTGTGGFTFQTTTASGLNPLTNMNLMATGSVQVPYYSVTTAANDTETLAIASFDASGNLVRDYNTNSRIRSIETRVAVLEAETVVAVPQKVNEVIGRINSLNFFSTQIAPLVIAAPPIPNPYPSIPTANTPNPNIVSSAVTLGVTSAFRTAFNASQAAFTTALKNAMVSVVNAKSGLSGAAGLTASRIVAVAIGTSSYTQGNYPTYPASATAPGSGTMYYLTFTINPDPTVQSQLAPDVAGQLVITYASAQSVAQNGTASPMDLAVQSAASFSGAVFDLYYAGNQAWVAYNAGP